MGRPRLWLVKLRKARRMTQEQLASKVGCDVGTISRCERGKHLPLEDTQAAIGEALGLTCEEALSRFRDEDTFGCAILAAEVTAGSLDRRDFILGAAGVVVAPLGLSPTAVPSVVGQSNIAQLILAASQLAEMENIAGGGGLVRVVGHAQLTWAKALLNASCPSAIRSELFSSVAALASEVAFAAFDSGDCSEATALYRFATEVAEHSENWSVRAIAYSDMARVITWDGNHDRALTCAEQALVRSDRLSSVERAMVHTVRGRALAAMGRGAEAERAIGMADEAFGSRRGGDEEPSWMRFYDDAQHQGDTGHALYDVARHGGDPAGADRRLRAAVNGHASSYLRSRAFSRGKLASLLLRCGDLDEGLATAEVAVSELKSVHSHRTQVYVQEIAAVAGEPRFAKKAAALLERAASGHA